MGDVVLVPAAAAPARRCADSACRAGPGPRQHLAARRDPRSRTAAGTAALRERELRRSSTARSALERYCASSILAPQLGNSYGVQHLFEGNGSTAWVEGKPGQGVGRVGRGRVRRAKADQRRSKFATAIRRIPTSTTRTAASGGCGSSFRRAKAEPSRCRTNSGRRRFRSTDRSRPIGPSSSSTRSMPGNKYSDTALSRLLVASDRAP